MSARPAKALRVVMLVLAAVLMTVAVTNEPGEKNAVAWARDLIMNEGPARTPAGDSF